MKPTIKIILRTDYTTKDGLNSVFLRLTISRKQKYYNLNISVPIKFWDKGKSRVFNKCPDSYKINLLIDSKYNRAKNIIFDYELKNKELTFTDFEYHFNSSISNKNSFYDYCLEVIRGNLGKYAKETQRTYTSQITKLKQFKNELHFNEVTETFINQYLDYMINKLGNDKNTYFKSLGFIKTMVNKAITLGIIKETPFKNIHIKKIEGHRNYLTFEELKKLKEIFSNSPLTNYQKNVLKYFLFACYTGLRFQDVKDLKYSNIQNNNIVFKAHKTKEYIKIPLIDFSKTLIGTELFKEQNIFRVLSNQKTNEYLKEIMKIAQINKKISFHCSRHTFATLSLAMGFDPTTIKTLLGHRFIQTTLIYAKTLDKTINEQMNKWNDI